MDKPCYYHGSSGLDICDENCEYGVKWTECRDGMLSGNYCFADLEKLNTAKDKEIGELREIISALQDINIAYRIGGQPKEKSLRILEKVRNTFKERK